MDGNMNYMGAMVLRKRVNGKIIDIGNIELFEHAYDGMLTNRKVSNHINKFINFNPRVLGRYISTYRKFYNSLPFPIYSIDTDLKYCIAGLYIKKELGSLDKIWVDNGLFICLDEPKKIALNFVNDSWGVVIVDDVISMDLDINNYSSYVGFDEFVWVISNMFNNNSINSYYNIFMPEFIKACEYKPDIMKKELGNILNLFEIPDELYIRDNVILDVQTRSEYIFDIYNVGTRDYNGTEMPVYGYDSYIKEKSGLNNKLRLDKLASFNGLFCNLCAIRAFNNYNDFPIFKGLIADNRLVYYVDNKVFVAKANRGTEGEEIACGYKIHSYKSGVVYLSKTEDMPGGIQKKLVYSYGLKTKNLTLCGVIYK